MDAILSLPVLIGLIIVALAFDFLNGLHDAANFIATIVSTRVLRPRYAVMWAAFFNFIAFVFFGLHVAQTVGTGIVAADIVDARVIFGALSGAIGWNLITWWLGIPSSSSHALIGGLVGAGVTKAGSVTTQATTMLPATPQRTAEARRAAPTPMIAPVMVCVVDTGTPSPVAMNSVIAPPVSAQKPCMGVSRVILLPIVWTMRQPPRSVPSPIAAWQARTTQNGTSNSGPVSPWLNSSTAMMPMVFCASLPPWPSE